MAELMTPDTGECITRYVSLETGQDATRIIQQTLDGRQYIQRIGNPVFSFTVTAYVTAQGKTRILQAEDSGECLKVTVGSGVYFGRILDRPVFEKLTSGYYKATMTLAKEAEG
jgi:hypothetical protein